MKEQKQPDTNGTFDARRFMKQPFSPREGEVPVPALKDFFPDGGEAVWKVRGLTADEIARCNEAGERNKRIEAIADALMASNKSDNAEGIKEYLGISSDVHGEVVKRIEQLKTASVKPLIAHEVAVKIAEVFPVEFYAITNEILRLTGLGQVAGKSKPSGKEQT